MKLRTVYETCRGVNAATKIAIGTHRGETCFNPEEIEPFYDLEVENYLYDKLTNELSVNCEFEDYIKIRKEQIKNMTVFDVIERYKDVTGGETTVEFTRPNPGDVWVADISNELDIVIGEFNIKDTEQFHKDEIIDFNYWEDDDMLCIYINR